jgi:hypothetical protein
MANLRVREQGKLTVKDSDNSNSVSLQSPSTVSEDQDFIVPNADGSANEIITTNASGTLSFTDINTLVISDIDWQTGDIKTGDFTAVAGKGYFVNTTSGTITATLPSSPSANDFVAFKDYAATFGSNKLTIARNGSNIQAAAVDSDITTDRASVVLQFIDATKGWLYTVENNVGDLENKLYVTATGGTITTSGDYKIHTFLADGTFTVSCAGNAAGSNKVSYVVVAGGGGAGGSDPGSTNDSAVSAGGAGGYREGKAPAFDSYSASPLAAPDGLPVSATGYPITVGGGGSGTGCSAAGSQGQVSTFSTITSAGGGGGGGFQAPCGSPVTAISGGSGGGGATYQNNPGACTQGLGNTPPVSPPQGQDGGTGTGGRGGAGGGGAGAVGGAGSSPGQGGNGGDGVTSSINASPVTRAGGGGGGGTNNPFRSHPAGTGGSGGGGAGSVNNTGSTAGTCNTGGGGGGGGRGPGISGSSVGANGGSGIVIIRYKYQN